MELEVSYELENAEQFWAGALPHALILRENMLTRMSIELDDIVSTHCGSEETIDNALRSWLHFTTNFRDEYLQSDYDLARCSLKLLQSVLFTENKDYVRRQIIYCLLQEDDTPTLHLITTFLLFDGRANDPTFEMMKEEGAFVRLVELIQGRGEDDAALHRLLLELLYEMSRIQQLGWEDLMTVDDAFLLHLFRIIEGVSNDVDDPYHYPVIRVLLVLNEQYMVCLAPSPPHSKPITNRVIKTLSTHGISYKTFGENLILLLNRESETSLQLLILKLLYLLFTTPSTQEYFYTNDLHVLVDVMMRNLLDLPDESSALRHTYLRVLHPLLAYTQLRHPPHYKQPELQRLLHALGGAQDHLHFAPVSSTTLRLVTRCLQVPWLQPSPPPPIITTNPTTNPFSPQIIPPSDSPTPTSSSPDKDAPSPTTSTVAKRLLGMNLASPTASDSSLSVAEVAAHTEKPGVQTPSRQTVEIDVNKALPPIPGREGRPAARTEARNGGVGVGVGGLMVRDEKKGGMGEERERSPFSASEDEGEE
ncbi:MAG: hypothetical protein M1820_005760 [Bogoriella megaspora]|nr:MAG: hypothetical protein M1820_005760 [Bogoriella megaspora]